MQAVVAVFLCRPHANAMIMENAARSRVLFGALPLSFPGLFSCHSRAGGNPVFSTPEESTIGYLRVL